MVNEFTTNLSLDECISELKALPQKYFSMHLNISVVRVNDDNYRFDMHAKGVPKNPMDMTVFGHMKRITATSTQVYVDSIVANRFSYPTQHTWILSPLILLAAFISSNPAILLGIPFTVVFSLATWVTKQQDRDEILRILERALGRMSTS